METKRAFISFDFDHDEDIKNLLVGQAKNPDTPFEIHDWSVKEPLTGNWKEKVRSRIRRTHFTIVLCGESTHTATGVATELARDLGADAIVCSTGSELLSAPLRMELFFVISRSVHLMVRDSEESRVSHNITDWWSMRGDASSDGGF